MKRSGENFYKRIIPAKRCKGASGWEETMTSGRIIDLQEKLTNCLRVNDYTNSSKDFLDCLDNNACTNKELKEVANLSLFISWAPSETMLLVATRHLDYIQNLKLSLKVLRKLIKADPNLIFASNKFGSVPLHYALKYRAPYEVIELLLDADPSKKTLFMRDKCFGLPLYLAVEIRREMKIFKLLLSNLSDETKKELLDSKTGAGDPNGQTPIEIACSEAYGKNLVAFQLLTEERIQLVPAGIPSRQQQLRGLVQKFLELEVSMKGGLNYYYFKSSFIKIFYEAINEFENWIIHKPEEISLLQLAVWKGRGFDSVKSSKKQRWITCGAHQIGLWVAEYLGMDPILRLKTEYDRIISLL